MDVVDLDPAFVNLRSLVATRTRRLLIWCGAGLSVPAGIPAWGALQRRLEMALGTKINGMEMPERQREAKQATLASIRREANPWVAFGRLQTELGATTFREVIREALSKSASVDVPAAYFALWKLRPYGVITLNLDRLATRAALEAEVEGVIEFKGRELASYGHTLSSPRPFICNIHGIEEDVASWIFTKSDLKSLSESEAYQSYISAVLMSSTVIFLGLTADDVAVGGHLERLASLGVKTSAHYWITDRRDPATDKWAERNGVVAIRYRPTSSDHPELIEILEQLASYVQPEDGPQAPVSFELDLGGGDILPPNELARQDPEKIREDLNSFASRILASGGGDEMERFDKFSLEYDRAIHSSWYISTVPGGNLFLGHYLEEEVAKGAFGAVYRATDKDGQACAIKILHAEIRKERELLNAFRRGVRSMRILGKKNVEGMVKYRAASEFPATLVMDWIDGPSLTQVIESVGLNGWEEILEVSFQLADIISTAHSLPERVLHRDVRPSNIMIEGFWDSQPIKVVVLDFDLSWHRGSVEKSVIFGSQLSGYLAPEQVQARNGVSTQHASVDSYGIGMTLFFMVARRNPRPGEHAYKGWESIVEDCCSKIKSVGWKSLGRRFSRLIVAATYDSQAQRWDVSQVRSELMRLREAANTPESVQSAELLAEELATRCQMMAGYEWDDAKFQVRKDFGTGLVLTLYGDESARQVVFELRRTANEAADRNRMADMISKARDLTRGILQESGWDVSSDIGKGLLVVIARIDSSVASSDTQAVADSIRRAIERSSFQ